MKMSDSYRLSPKGTTQVGETKRLHHWKFYILYSTFAFLTALLVFAWDVSLQAQEEPYLAVTGPCGLSFPQDHGAHPGHRTEWWYYTGNLHSQGGREFGFQLTFFRRQISPPGAEKGWPRPASAWRTQQVFVAHAALSDVSGKGFYHAEHISREMPGLAGASQQDGVTEVYLKNWACRLAGNEYSLDAQADHFGFKLGLTSLKRPVLHGDQGYSKKGTAPERASCYYSMTRLAAEGVVSLGGISFPVEGTAWMDHEFSSTPLEPDLAGWDWFSLQLSNNTELMIYLLRRKDGSLHQASSGTLVEASGKTLHLARNAIQVEVLDHWQSPRSGATYPSGWHLRIPTAQLDLHLHTRLSDQELQTPATTDITYWEGSVAATGTLAGTTVTGKGYIELTGYAGTMAERL